MIKNDDFQKQNIWVIGSTSPLIHAKYQPNASRGQIINIAISKTHVYFAVKDQIGSFKIIGTPEEIPEDKITYEPAKDVVQVVCGNEYVAYRTMTGEIYARGNPFPATFTKIKNKKEADMPPAVSITGTPYFLFAIITQGRFCIISGNSVIYHKKRNVGRWYISSTMFLGTVLLLGHTGRAYTMSFNENNPTLSNTLQVFSEDPCLFTSLFSCHESLFFLTVNDYVVSYGYNHHGCLGVGHENTVSTLVRFHPPMNGESICEIAPSSDFTFFLTQSGNLYVSGQSPYDKTTTSQPVIFKPLEGKRITQIRTCGAICVALEGGHKDYNSTSTPPDKYKLFPITIVPTCYTGILGGPIRVLPYPPDYTKFWYQPGDIVSRKETKGKIIGLSTTKHPIIGIAHLKRIMIIETDNFSNDGDFTDFLLRRPGHHMFQASLQSKNAIYLDISNSVISKFGGFNFGDLVETKSGTRGIVFGARGEFLWIKPLNTTFVVNVKDNELTLLSRKVKSKDDLNDKIHSNSNSNSDLDLEFVANSNSSNINIDLLLNADNSSAATSSSSVAAAAAATVAAETLDHSPSKCDLVPFDISENERFWGHLIKDEKDDEKPPLDSELDFESQVNKNDIFFLPELGLCYMIGYTDEKLYFYKRIDESQCYIKSKIRAPMVRKFKKDISHHKSFSKSEVTDNDNDSERLVSSHLSVSHLPSSDSLIVLSDMSAIDGLVTNYEETANKGFLPYDRILTPKGYATVLGIHSEKVVAMTDEMYVSNSLADVFSTEEVEMVAKVDNKPCLKKFKAVSKPPKPLKSSKSDNSEKKEEIQLLINVSAFIDQEMIVQDRVSIIDLDDKVLYGFVAGISNDENNTIYVMMDNEDFVRPLTSRHKLVARYLHIMANEIGMDHKNNKNTIFYKSLMHFAGSFVKPGDVICHDKTMVRSTVCGITSSGDLALRPAGFDDNGFFALDFLSIGYKNIKYDVPTVRKIQK